MTKKKVNLEYELLKNIDNIFEWFVIQRLKQFRYDDSNGMMDFARDMRYVKEMLISMLLTVH